MPPPEIPFIPLLAMPGPKGAVIQIPWQLITSGVAAMGAMPPGKWAEMANLTRQVEREMLSRPPAGLGFFGWIRRLMMWALLCILGWGVIIVINERFLKSKAVPPARSEDDPKAELRWNQPAAVLKSSKLVASDKYEPLRGEGGTGRGFLLRVGQMGILAVTTRHQFEVRNVAPNKLYADGGGEITLDTQTVYRQPESQVQMVTEISKPADYLEYFAAEFVKEGDRLRLVLGAGDWIEGVVTSKGAPISKAQELQRHRPPAEDRLSHEGGSRHAGAAAPREVGGRRPLPAHHEADAAGQARSSSCMTARPLRMAMCTWAPR
jgi:hypothetical protein